MSLSALLLGVWLILVGIGWMGWAVLDLDFLGIFALVTGIAWLVEGFGFWSYTIGSKRQ